MYEIKVLSSDEFDKLPIEETRGSRIDDSLGFGNKFTGRAFVRDSGLHDLTKYLVSHELEELMADESTHEDENGIRHKKGPKFFKDILAPLFGGAGGGAITGGVPGAILGGLGGAAQGIGGYQNRASQHEPASYAPTTGLNAFGAAGSPLDLFGGNAPSGGLSSSAPQPSGLSSGSISIGQGAQNQELPPELLRQLRAGNYAGQGSLQF